MSRWGYRIAELVEKTGLSESTIRRQLKARCVPRRKVGRMTLYEATAAEHVVGFGSAPQVETELSSEDLAIARRLVAGSSP